MATEFHIRIRSTLDRNKFGFVNELLVYIPIPPWLSALNAIGLARQSMNRKLIHTTQFISVKRGRREGESEEAGIAAAARKFYSLRSSDE